MTKTFSDLSILAKNKEQFLHFINLCENKAKIFYMQFGFDFRNWRARFPKSEKELFQNLDPIFKRDRNIVKKAVNYLFNILEQGLERKELMQQDSSALIEMIDKKFHDYIEKNKQFIPRENLVNLILQEPVNREEEEGKRPDLLSGFKKKYEHFIGKDSRVGKSEFEGYIADKLQQIGIFFRQQVPYRQVMPTNRRFIMDFLIGRTILETGSVEDDFIHNENYWNRMQEKQELALDNDYNFLFVDEFTDLRMLQGLKKEKYDFSELYEEKEPEFMEFIPGPERNVNKRQVYFATCTHEKLAMIGYLKNHN